MMNSLVLEADEPFVKYYLGILIKASNEFESRV